MRVDLTGEFECILEDAHRYRGVCDKYVPNFGRESRLLQVSPPHAQEGMVHALAGGVIRPPVEKRQHL